MNIAISMDRTKLLYCQMLFAYISQSFWPVWVIFIEYFSNLLLRTILLMMNLLQHQTESSFFSKFLMYNFEIFSYCYISILTFTKLISFLFSLLLTFLKGAQNSQRMLIFLLTINGISHFPEYVIQKGSEE